MQDGGFSKSEIHHVACGCTWCQCAVMSCFIKMVVVTVTIWSPGTCKSRYQGPFMMMQHWSVQPRSHLEKRWKDSNGLYEKTSVLPRTTARSAGWWNVPAIIRKMAYRLQWQNTEKRQHKVHLWDRNKKLPQPQGLPFKKCYQHCRAGLWIWAELIWSARKDGGGSPESHFPIISSASQRDIVLSDKWERSDSAGVVPFTLRTFSPTIQSALLPRPCW